MKVGSLVKFKGPPSLYSWRHCYGEGVGVVIKGPHRTERCQRGCTIMWPVNEDIVDVPEDWLEVISESW